MMQSPTDITDSRYHRGGKLRLDPGGSDLRENLDTGPWDDVRSGMSPGDARWR